MSTVVDFFDSTDTNETQALTPARPKIRARGALPQTGRAERAPDRSSKMESEVSETVNDVVIVGAGPVGMALAITLAKSGVRPMVIERDQVQQTTSRAAVIHAHTLDILDRIGVADRMRSEGRLIRKFAIRDGGTALGKFSFDDLPSRNNFLLMLPQDRTEAIMLMELAARGIEISRGVTFCGMREAGDRVIVELKTPTGTRTVATRYLIGTDGMHSEVRKSCAIPFDGGQYEDSFVLADVTIDGAQGYDEVSLFFSPAGLMVVAPLPGGRFRVVATLDNAPEKPDADLIQRLIDTRGPASPGMGTVRDVTWSSRFRLHHRLARKYRKGRVFIAGDAAHAHSPAGGQGMNTGIVDAYTLGRLLAGVLVGGAPDQTLDRYEDLRRPAAVEVLRLAGRLTDAALVQGPAKRAMRNVLLSSLIRVPPLRRRIELSLSGLSRQSATVSE
jgi:2-polyprenyl-6-methoxyphenol hydroxylase-like FAD-dependent oxidoreductase